MYINCVCMLVFLYLFKIEIDLLLLFRFVCIRCNDLTSRIYSIKASPSSRDSVVRILQFNCNQVITQIATSGGLKRESRKSACTALTADQTQWNRKNLRSSVVAGAAGQE